MVQLLPVPERVSRVLLLLLLPHPPRLLACVEVPPRQRLHRQRRGGHRRLRRGPRPRRRGPGGVVLVLVLFPSVVVVLAREAVEPGAVIAPAPPSASTSAPSVDQSRVQVRVLLLLLVILVLLLALPLHERRGRHKLPPLLVSADADAADAAHDPPDSIRAKLLPPPRSSRPHPGEEVVSALSVAVAVAVRVAPSPGGGGQDGLAHEASLSQVLATL